MSSKLNSQILRSPSNSSAGFTLLELLISLVILGTLTALSARSIQQALFSKAKIQAQLDEMSQVRDALKIIERDVNLAFHYRDLELEFRDAVKKAGSPAGQNQTANVGAAGQAGTFTTGFGQPGVNDNPPATADEIARKANRLDPVTHFIGTSDSMSFATTNTGRLTDADTQADFIKVGYSVRPCKRMSGKQETTQCLFRRSDMYVEGDITKGGEETALVEDISEFKLRYFGKGKQDWVDAWNSKEGDGATINNFPGAVEISMTTESGGGPKKRKVSMQIVAAIRFTNNPPRTGTGTSTGTSQP